MSKDMEENGFSIDIGEGDGRAFVGWEPGESLVIAFTTGVPEETYFKLGFNGTKYPADLAPEPIRNPRYQGDIFEVEMDGEPRRLDLTGALRFGVRDVLQNGKLIAGRRYRVTRTGRGHATRYLWSVAK